MVVAHVVLTLDPGGQEFLVIQLAERLQRRGWRSPVITISGGALAQDARRLGIETFDLRKGAGFSPATLVRLARVLRAEGVDIVHTHNMAPLIYGTLSARALGIPTINTRHGRAALTTHWLIWRLADHVVAVSDDARREMLRHNSIAPAKVHVILNGTDVQAFATPTRDRAAVRASLGIPVDHRLFGIVARLAPEKDHQTLFEAFERVAQAEGAAALLVIGGGPLEADLRARAGSLGILERVRFLGFRQDIPDLLAALDVFVLSSTMEGVSLTLLEAMAAGLPVVATRVGGNPEVVAEGETGLLVPPRDARALSEAMLVLLRNPERAAAFGERGRERVRRQFDIEQMVDAYVALYEAAWSRVRNAARPRARLDR